MKLICISDVHEQWDKLTIPAGDVLICSGDITFDGNIKKIEEFNEWLGTLSHIKHKIVIAGNHDFCFTRKWEHNEKLITNATYLEDQELLLDGVLFYGSPWVPVYGDWAFMDKRGKAMQEHWDKIPDNVEVLITHGPPEGILDSYDNGYGNVLCGCANLRNTIQDRLKKLKVHIFGHIHSGYGARKVEDIMYINASSCNNKYKPVNGPLIYNIESGEARMTIGWSPGK